MNAEARKSPDFLKDTVIYQIFLRSFTREGTLKSAEKMLPHLKNLGVTMVYLCPIVESDDDPRKEFWSPRQIKSGMNNPKNPYRIKDYFRIDPEYGTDDDLKSFVGSAHHLGLKVMLDLVYFHCGPAATLITEHPDFVRLGEDGQVKNGVWCFPEINFENPALREYLWGNMAYFVREFDVDGYRIDVGTTMMPVEFFEEAHRRLEKINPDIVILGECEQPTDELEAFDLDYGGSISGCLRRIFSGEPVSLIAENEQRLRRDFPRNVRFTLHVDNHDIANDGYENRLEHTLGADGKSAMAVAQMMLKGIPMIYNGEEVADSNRHSIWANREHGRGYVVDWENVLTRTGKARLKLYRKLLALRKSHPELTEGTLTWIPNDSVLAFWRSCQGKRILAVVNPRKEKTSVSLPLERDGVIGKILLKKGFSGGMDGKTFQGKLAPYGYFVAEIL